MNRNMKNENFEFQCLLNIQAKEKTGCTDDFNTIWNYLGNLKKKQHYKCYHFNVTKKYILLCQLYD